ncbi:MAG: aminodeoxychorismate/anthranilate synthase component II [Acidobacteriaceae bacterium]|nr:aminodeoxychorismate/anthranilate synthase component II [Acidobacteriaceae bacterium]
MHTLIIDNYDSFTFNLVHAVARITGCTPLVIRNDEFSWAEVNEMQFDNVIISPGPGNPGNDRDFGLSREAIHYARVPVLGVCLGHQGIALEFGGKVIPSPEPMHGRSSLVFHSGDDLFSDVCRTDFRL